MGIEFEPRIERTIDRIVHKTGLPRGEVVLALEGLSEFRGKIPADILQSSVRGIEEDHQEPIEATMLKARFGQAGSVTVAVQKVHHRHPTWLERFGDRCQQCTVTLVIKITEAFPKAVSPVECTAPGQIAHVTLVNGESFTYLLFGDSGARVIQ